MKILKLHLLKNKSGMETLEAAITTPIVILVMLATVNLGMVVFAQQAVEQAARHGARMGSVAQGSAAYYAYAYAQDAIKASKIVQNPSVSILSASSAPGSILTVEVSGTVPSFIGGLIPKLGASFAVSAEAKFRQEGWQ